GTAPVPAGPARAALRAEPVAGRRRVPVTGRAEAAVDARHQARQEVRHPASVDPAAKGAPCPALPPGQQPRRMAAVPEAACVSAILALVGPGARTASDAHVRCMLASMAHRGSERIAIRRSAGAVLAVARDRWEMDPGFAGGTLVATRGPVHVVCDAT